MATRAATHQLGAKMLEKLLSSLTDYESTVPCDCGRQARFHEVRPKQILTVLGPITISSAPIIYVRTVIKDRVPATRNWM